MGAYRFCLLGRFWNWLTSKSITVIWCKWNEYIYIYPVLISGWSVLKAFYLSGLWAGSCCWNFSWLFASVLNWTEVNWHIINCDYHLVINDKAKEWLFYLFIIYHFTVLLFRLNVDFDCCRKQNIWCWNMAPMHYCSVEKNSLCKYLTFLTFWRPIESLYSSCAGFLISSLAL